jgi:hypothetical protein
MSNTTRAIHVHRRADNLVARTLAAEWTKLTTLRSTAIMIVAATAVSVVLSAVVTAAQVAQWDDISDTQRAGFDPISAALVGVLLLAVMIGSLGIRSVTSEHTTGMIRLTYAAMPRRRLVLIAKSLAVAVVALPAAIIANLGTFIVGHSILATKEVGVPLDHAVASRAITFGAIAVGLIAVLGVALGSILPQTSAATTSLSVAIVGSPLLGIALPAGVRKYLPGSALQATVSGERSTDLLTSHTGLATLAAYTLVTMVLALIVVDRVAV